VEPIGRATLRRAWQSGTLLLIGFAQAGALQPPVVSKSCATCSIRLEPVVTLQALWDSGGIVARPKRVLWFPNNEWWLVDDRGVHYRFDRRGVFIGPLGRAGAGPGEFRRVDYVTTYRGDSVLVFDTGLHRVTVVSPAGRPSRTFAWPGTEPLSAQILPDGGFIANLAIRTPSSFGHTLHHFAADGSLKRSFGGKPSSPVGQDWIPHHWLVGGRTDSTVWAVTNSYPSVQQFTLDGVLRSSWTIPVTAAWGWRRPSGDELPRMPYQVGDAWWSPGEPTIWLTIWYPSPRWRQAFGRSEQIDGVPSRRIESYARYASSIVLVLDIERRAVLATKVVDGMVIGFVGRGSAIAILEPTAEEDVVRIYRAALNK